MYFEDYILTDDFNITRSGESTTYYISLEGFNILYESYCKLYGTSEPEERIISLGGFKVSDIRHYKSERVLSQNFNFLDYVTKIYI